MYVPETQGITGFPDSVIVMTNDGPKVGRYRGMGGDELFEIHVIDPMTDETEASFFHKEDIYKNTSENWERLTS